MLNEKKDAGIEIEVTSAMVDAGMDALSEHHLYEDLRYVVECIFRAMAYENFASASSITSAKY